MAKAKVKKAADAIPSEGAGYWIVSLAHNRSAVVEAASKAEAVEEYKQVMGIRSSDHEFKADYLPDGIDHLDIDEFGVLLSPPAQPKEDDDE